MKFIMVLALLMVLLNSCEKVVGEGPVVSQTRDYTNFESVSVNIAGKVTHSIGNSFLVRLYAQQNILDIIQTRMDGNELVIKFKDGKRVNGHEEINVELISPTLKSVSLSGSAEFRLTSEIDAAQMALQVSGSGNIAAEKINLSGQLRATISGSGNITVNEGAINSSWLKISGSGNIYVDALPSISSYTEISGSGNIRLHANESLEAYISGSGSVLYRGTPQVSSRISGSGSVRPL